MKAGVRLVNSNLSVYVTSSKSFEIGSVKSKLYRLPIYESLIPLVVVFFRTRTLVPAVLPLFESWRLF